MSKVLKEIDILGNSIQSDGTYRGRFNHHIGTFVKGSVGSLVPNKSMHMFVVYIEDVNGESVDLNYAFNESRYAEAFSTYLESNIASATNGETRVGIKPMGGMVVKIDDKDILLGHNGRYYTLVAWCDIAKMDALLSLNHKQLDKLATVEERTHLHAYSYLIEHISEVE